MQLFYYLQLIHLIRDSPWLKENTTKTEKAEKINIEKKNIIVPLTNLNFHTMGNLRSQDKDYNINVHCGKKKIWRDLTW